jgi:Ni,Fe-hydrogenase III small subunit/ferredoxin
MLEWVLRGLRTGIVTTAYPSRPEPAPPGFRGRVEVTDARGADEALEAVCPTGAVRVADGEVSLDRARCVLCGACVTAAPGRFRYAAAQETAARRRADLLEPPGVRRAAADALPALAESAGPLRRSIHVRHVDAGSDGAEEWEIAALTNPYYDMQRLGLFFTLSPRHADILLVTGAVTHPMRRPLERAYEAMPGPKAVVAAGTDACGGGFAEGAGEVAGGVDRVLPVTVWVPGAPPSPIALLDGLLQAAGAVTRADP